MDEGKTLFLMMAIMIAGTLILNFLVSLFMQ